jgi:ferredoxin
VSSDTDDLAVWVDQDLCTGDGLCVQYAPEVFEFDVDGLAYVKDPTGALQLTAGSRVEVPSHLRLDVIDSARECPGECIHVLRATDGIEVAGPQASVTPGDAA